MIIDDLLFEYFDITLSILIILLVIISFSIFAVFSILRNRYAIYYPFLAALWFGTVFLEMEYDNSIENTLFYDIRIDLAVYFYGMIILPVLLFFIGIFLIIVKKWKKLTYEKKDWKECIILSPFPIALLYSAIAYRGGAFLDVSLKVFIIAIIIDKLILIVHKHYFIHTGLKILLLLIVIKWSEISVLAQLLIVITDCMFGYVILQFISLIDWYNKQKKELIKGKS